MAIVFSQSVNNLLIGRGLMAAIAGSSAISIYSGTQPTSAQIEASWLSFNSSSGDFLAHYVGGVWTQPSNGILLQLTGLPSPVPAMRTGTGTWCIVWTTNVSDVEVAGSTLPHTNFIVGACSNEVGDGIIRFADPAFIAATSKPVLDGSIGATF